MKDVKYQLNLLNEIFYWLIINWHDIATLIDPLSLVPLVQRQHQREYELRKAKKKKLWAWRRERERGEWCEGTRGNKKKKMWVFFTLKLYIKYKNNWKAFITKEMVIKCVEVIREKLFDIRYCGNHWLFVLHTCNVYLVMTRNISLVYIHSPMFICYVKYSTR